MKRRFAIGLAALIWSCIAAAGQASPLFEPGIDWRTVETAHFRIYHTPDFTEKARQVAKIAEDAHARLVPYMQVAPGGPTEVVIADGYDDLNSLAHASPHRAIWLWMTPPNPDEGMPIGRYDDWLKLLFVHEYTHILQYEHTPVWINQANSAVSGLLFSALPQLPIEITLALPDLLSDAPSFFTEGLAVHTESTLTPGGRGKEGEFDMLRRMAFHDDRVPTLDQVWGRNILEWPIAGYEYTWGAAYVRHMVERFGEDAPARVLKAYGRMPWIGFGAAMKQALGESPQGLWSSLRASLGERYAREKAIWQARRAAFKGAEFRLLTSTGRHHRHPVWDGADTLMYAEALKNESPRLIRHTLDSGARKPVMGKSTRSSVAMLPGGDTIYFERDTSDTIRKLTSYRDLFAFDRKTRKTRRLTHAARTFAPALAPDGARLSATTSGGGRSGIAVFDTDGRLLKKWTEDNNTHQFGNPAWRPDGKAIAVSMWQGGTRDLALIDPETGERTRLFKDAAVDFYPAWSPDGRYLVFSSDRNGASNLYALALASGKLHQLTDVLGGAFDPAVSPDGRQLAFSSYGGRGYDIAVMPFDPAHAPVVTTLPRPDAAAAAEPPPAGVTDLGRYSPFPTFRPSTWFAIPGRDERGTNLTVYSFWQDVLRQHEATLVGGYGFFSGRLHYGLRYENSQFHPQFAVSVNEFPQAGLAPLNDGSLGTIWQWNKSASLALNFPGLRNPMFDPPPIEGVNWTVGARTEAIADYALETDTALVPLDTPHPPQPLAQDAVTANSLFVQWQRAEQLRYPYDYGPQEGALTSLGAEQGLPVLGGAQTFTRLWADHRLYRPLPWGNRHSLALRTTAGAVYGRNGEFYYAAWRQPFGYQPLSTLNRWDLTTLTPFDNRQLLVRGYPFLAGNRNLTAALEYRLPLAEVMRGLPGLPLFVDRLYGVGFWDAGLIWGDDSRSLAPPVLSDFKSGVGLEVRAQSHLLQYLNVDVRAGLARGLTAGGAWQLNWGLGTTF